MVVLVTLLMAGCTRSPQPVVSDVPEFETYSDKSILFYDEQDQSGRRMTFSFTLVDVFGPAREAGSLTSLIRNLVYDGQSPKVYTERIIASYRDQYTAMKEAEAEEAEPEISSEALNWEYTETVEGNRLASHILGISQEREYFLGGAHGMREKKYFVIDTKQVRQLKIADLIKNDAEPNLESAIEAALRAYVGIEKGAALSTGGFFEDTLTIPDNFFLTAEGIGFHWDPYEIAPYVMGSIEVVLPFTLIENWLSPQGKVLITV